LVQVYEEHLSDSFAAMLDMSHPGNGPIIYFYCLANPTAAATDAAFNAFAAAHHVVLDTSVPFVIVKVSLEQGSSIADCQGTENEVMQQAATADKPGKESKTSLAGIHDTDTTNGEAQTHETLIGVGCSPPDDDDRMSMCIL
jgi:hypothetical protein